MADEKLKPCPFGGGRWRLNIGGLICCTVRVARIDFDTDPSEEFQQEVFDWVTAKLNAPTISPELFERLQEALNSNFSWGLLVSSARALLDAYKQNKEAESGTK